MVARATAAEVLKLMGGEYIAGSDATMVGNLLDSADYWMDGYTKPHTLSTSGTSEISIANEIVVNLVMHSIWQHDGGPASGKPEPEILTSQIKDQLERLKVSIVYDGAVYGEMIDDT